MTDSHDIVTISSSRMTASVSTLGAELQSFDDAAGNAYLWHGDPDWWPSRAPILFPIVGMLTDDTHVVDGRSYKLGRHGFARRSRFAISAQSVSTVTMHLEETPESLAAYPYRFGLDISFALDGFTLGVTASVTNTDDQPIPVGFGFHPAFLWPFPGSGARDAQELEFDAPEPVPAWRINSDGLVVRQEAASRVIGRRLKLDDALFDEEALLFLEPASRGVTFGNSDGSGCVIDVAFPEMPHLGVWTKAGGAPFLCIEPWYGYASPVGFTGSLMEKPGMSILEPGEIREYGMQVTLQKPTTALA